MTLAGNVLRWRMGVPVATPIGLREWKVAAAACWAGKETQCTFEQELRDFLGVPWVRSTISGRAALYLALVAMRRNSRRNEVLIPAFVCPSVGRAVVKAGLRPVLCDVGPTGSGLDPDDLRRKLRERTLAVVTAHLFGFPVDVEDNFRLAHSAGAMVIEDAAQAFGSTVHGRRAGTNADVGIFSFGMSKVLWSFAGGALCSNNAVLSASLDDVLGEVQTPGWRREWQSVAKAAFLSLLLRSHHLGPVAAIWNGALRGKNDCDDFPVELCLRSAAALGQRMIRRFCEVTSVRRRNAERYAEALAELDGITLPQLAARCESVYLRLPVIVQDAAMKRRIVHLLWLSGINVSEMYTRSSYDALRTLALTRSPCPIAEYLMERMLHLPTHCYLRPFEIESAIQVFRGILPTRAPIYPPGAASGQAKVCAS
jgi:perosamine synthetase